MNKLILTLSILLATLGSISQEFGFIYDGIERTYRVYAPEINRESASPMVINMHGLGSNAFEQQFYSQFDNVADTTGAIIVYPNGVNNQWNIYSDGGVDDVGFISALIDTMAANYDIDLTRVYATGMSMGGFMSHRMACQLNNRIAAIGAVAGTLAYPFCAPGRAVPVCHIHGTADSTVFFDLVPVTIAFWTGIGGCADSVVVDLPDTDTTDQSTVTLTTYPQCDDDVEVLLYTINNGGHTWPGASIDIGDITNQDIHASAEIWNFFSKYTLPDWVGIPDQTFSEGSLIVYPNPVIQNAVIEVPESNIKSWILKIRDVSGRLMREEKTYLGNKIPFIRNGLNNGVYIIELSTSEMVLREKIILK